jgi:hypothetical protein
MAETSVGAILILGFVLGMRHALDADHLAAVATLAGGRGGVGRAMATGLAWGIGHALVLGMVGGTLVVLKVAIPGRLVMAFESLVAVMLVALGGWALAGALRSRVHGHRHEHDGVVHDHLHFHPVPHAGDRSPAGDAPHRHPHPLRFALRPLLVGGVHGLAGSAALSLLVLATVPTVILGFVYLAVFGAGSIAGMGLMAAALGAPLVIARKRGLWLHRALRAAAGAGSLGIGFKVAWDLWRTGL